MSANLIPSQIIQKAFPGVLEGEAVEMARVGETRSYPAGEILCREGAIEHIFYILLQGQVRVTKTINEQEDRLLNVLGPGDFFGEMALIHNAPRAATVTAITPVTVLEIDKDNFDLILHHHASVSLAMVREVSRRLRDNDAMAIEDLRVKSRELAIAYQQLAEQQYSQHEFLGSVGQALRKPLTAAYASLQGLHAGVYTGSAATDALEKVIKNLRTVIGMVNEILAAEEMDLILLEFQPLDLGALAGKLARQARPRARSSQVTIQVHLAEGMPPILGDEQSLRRAVNILLDNAIKFSPSGGTVRLETGYDDEEVWLQVSDQGAGIPPEAMPRLFRRFFRLEEAGGRPFAGVGLNLAIARQVVEQHGGQIDVESQPGKGSKFTIRLKRMA